VYLFLGGFIVATAIEKSGLHQRIALLIFSTVSIDAKMIIAGFMATAAFLSMWISNTSATIMMLPIAMSVVHVIRETVIDIDQSELKNFEIATYLSLAYGATMGGIATLVGTPPNAFMAGFMSSTYGVEIDFARWMIIGLPLTITMCPLIWFVLVRILFPVNFKASEQTLQHIATQKTELGKISIAEKRTAIVFFALVLLWLFRKPLISITGITGISDASVAILAALSLFVIPSGKGNEPLMRWSDTTNLPWGVLILIGGGLALAGAMTSSGLTTWIGSQLAPLVQINLVISIALACVLIIFLTELTSNLATTATFLPVIGALAVDSGVDPLIYVIPVTLAASFAFMLPIATPPNAIVFGSGRVSIREMMRAGLLLNILGVVVLTTVAVILVPKVFT